MRDVKYDIKKIKNIINFMKKELIKKLFEKFENACYLIAQNGDSSKPEIAFANIKSKYEYCSLNRQIYINKG